MASIYASGILVIVMLKSNNSNLFKPGNADDSPVLFLISEHIVNYFLTMQKVKLLVLTLLFSSIATAQTANREQSTIQQTVENMFVTLTNSDTAALKTFVTGNVRFYEYGQVWTIDTLIQKVIQNKSIPDFKRTNSFRFVHTSISNNTAWVTYFLESTFTRNGKEELVKWMETVVLVKEKKQWKVDVLHSTRLLKN